MGLTLQPQVVMARLELMATTEKMRAIPRLARTAPGRSVVTVGEAVAVDMAWTARQNKPVEMVRLLVMVAMAATQHPRLRTVPQSQQGEMVARLRIIG
jgi:hypothetical protein